MPHALAALVGAHACQRAPPPRRGGPAAASRAQRRAPQPPRASPVTDPSPGPASPVSLGSERRPGDAARNYTAVRAPDGSYIHAIQVNEAGDRAYSGEAAGPSDRLGAPASAARGPLAAARFALAQVFLPRGYPASVSEEYLEYMLWALPTHITGFLATTLTTASLLRGLGVGSAAGGATAAASLAAIKWVSKDGVGALGRLLIGSRMGNLFDEDPKRWRLSAEVVSLVGSALEISTPLAPAAFLPLAAAGQALKAVSKGLGRPSFRVVQNHMAKQDNVGEIAAKEELWEVTAEILGLAGGVAVLSVATEYETVAIAWAATAAVHFGLRYRALAAVRFRSLSRKRASLLAAAHVTGAPVPSVAAANAAEARGMLLGPGAAMFRPRVRFGRPLAEALDMLAPSREDPAALLSIYAGEKYILMPPLLPASHSQAAAGGSGGGDAAAVVVLKQAARPLDLLQALWQAAYLDRDGDRAPEPDATDTGAGTVERCRASLARARERMPDFVAQLEAQGWATDRVLFGLEPDAPVWMDADVEPQ